jgi:hypothetical protein
MTATQWLGWLFLLLIFGGILYAYLRRGAKIKPDDTRKTEDWPRITLGGS